MNCTKNKILVIAAHPDDEILGCGGSMAKWANNGIEVHVAILAEGATSRDSSRDRDNRKEEISALKRAAKKAGEILGLSSVETFNLSDNRMDSSDLLDIVKLVESKIESLMPEVVVTHHIGDVNIDHQVIHRAVVSVGGMVVGVVEWQ